MLSIRRIRDNIGAAEEERGMGRKMGTRYPRFGVEKGRQGNRPVVRDPSKISGNRPIPYGGPISEANRG